MSGATSYNDAWDKLSSELNSWLTYNGSQHFTYPDLTSEFWIEDFLSKSSMESGPTEGNDCRDFAVLANIFVSAVGLEFATTFNTVGFYFLTEILDENGNPILVYVPFTTHWIKPAKATATYTNWNFHVVNSQSMFNKIADASLRLDGDSDDSNQWTEAGSILPSMNIDPTTYKTKLTSATWPDFHQLPEPVMVEGLRP